MDYIQHLRSMVGHEKVIMVVSGALVLDDQERLLLQLRSGEGTWGIPGGFMDFNETVEEAARREVMEETGLELKHMELFGVYSGPRRDKTFANGDQVALVSILYKCDDFSGELQSLDESDDCRFFPLDHLPDRLFSEHRDMINDLMTGRKVPVSE